MEDAAVADSMAEGRDATMAAITPWPPPPAPQRPRTAGGAPGLLALPASLLEAVLSHVSFLERATVLPLVCRALRRLLAAPSAALWPDVTFEADLCAPEGRERSAAFLAWLRRHGRHSPSLQLDLWNGGLPPQAQLAALAPLLEQLQGALAACMPRCEFLRLRWGGPVLVAGDWLAGATALTCLALSGHEVEVGPALRGLASLAHLELSTLADRGPALAPACLPPSITRLCCVPAPAVAAPEPPDGGELAWVSEGRVPEQVLALSRLVYLDVSESLFTAAHLDAALPRLTRLTSLALDKCELPDGIPRQLSRLTALRVLSFDGCPYGVGQPGEGEQEGEQGSAFSVLACLSRLVSLSLSNCRLARLPDALLGASGLQHLYLEHNALRWLPAGPYLRRLRVLSTDWEPLLRSHALLAQAPHLTKLALGSQCVISHSDAELPPLAAPPELLAGLRDHPALRQVLLVARPTHTHGALCLVLDALLGLRGLRPTLDVQPIQHDAFFVEEPPLDDEGGAEGARGGLAPP